MEPLGRDLDGRTVNVVVVGNVNVNHTLVGSGAAWWYWKYASHDTTLEKLGLRREQRNGGYGVIRIPYHPASGGNLSERDGNAENTLGWCKSQIL